MAVAPVKLVQGAQLGTGTAVLIAAGDNIKVTAPTFTNTAGAAVTLTISIAYAGGTARVITNGVSVPANASYLAPELAGQVLTSGDTVSASASATGINVFISGISF